MKLTKDICMRAEVAEQIAAGNVVGWFQGRMEWGPRALGTDLGAGASAMIFDADILPVLVHFPSVWAPVFLPQSKD